MHLTTRIALVLCGAAWAAPREASAQAPAEGKTATLGWARLEGADGCIGTQELAQAVEKLLGRAVFVPASVAELAIEGRVEKRADGSFRAVLSVSNPKGESLGTRELSAETSCANLSEPAALAVALMIDPDAALGGPPPKPKEDPKPPDPPVRTVYVPVAVPVKEPPPPPPPTWSGDVALGFAMGFGWLPSVNPGAYGAASLEPPGFVPLEGALTFFAPMEADVPEGAAVSFYSLQGAGYLCPLGYAGSIGGVRACGGLVGGFVVANAEGFDFEAPDESGIYGTIGATLRGRGTLRVYELFHLGLGADFTVPFIRPDFVYTRSDGSVGRVFQSAYVLGALQAFAMVSFPR